MRETLRLLRDLQELDRDVYGVRDELRRLPAEKSRRETQIQIQRDRLAEMQARNRETRSKIKEIEDLTTIQRQRIRKLEGEAANSRGDTATLVAFQHEIRSLKREISEAEEEGLGLVEEADEVDREVGLLRSRLEEEESEFSTYVANVERELLEAEERLKGFEEERRRRSEPVQSAVLDQYEKLLEAREGQAMAMLDSRVCQGCYVNVPNNLYVRLARGLELVICPSCGRILYLPERS